MGTYDGIMSGIFVNTAENSTQDNSGDGEGLFAILEKTQALSVQETLCIDHGRKILCTLGAAQALFMSKAADREGACEEAKDNFEAHKIAPDP